METILFYGMTGALVFTVNQLLLPGHVEQIGGFRGFRALVESIVVPSTQAWRRIFGLYSGSFTSRRYSVASCRSLDRTAQWVVIGAVSMSAGISPWL